MTFLEPILTRTGILILQFEESDVIFVLRTKPEPESKKSLIFQSLTYVLQL